ncbi:muellerian-inhibiting factor isoform X2 [Syngnathoides biaculeatus]|nr:muellerian-inhibiting factor isoform X2 [Syngnathoides biaculeatus]XP_061680948.1 muellerian-inhibiting factor isoform X2 [Syngnathoides biaculeatus]
MPLCILRRVLLMLCWTGCCRRCAGLPDSPGWWPEASITATKRPVAAAEDGGEGSPTPLQRRSTVAALLPRRNTACFQEDLLAAMREALRDDGQLTLGGSALFGTCAASGNFTVLSDLVKDVKQGRGIEVLHPSEVFLMEEAGEVLTLNFGIPQSPLLQHNPNPVLLLALGSPVSGGVPEEITFVSRSLQPNAQTMCISEGSQYFLLTGKASPVPQRWMISIDAKSPDMKKRMKELLVGGSTRRSSVAAVLLFLRDEDASRKVPSSSRTLSFLCELRRFLSDTLPRNRLDSPPLRLDSLQALPPVTLGPSSSESALAELINSSAPTIFSFTGSRYHVHRGELAMPPDLLDQLRHGLELNLLRIRGVLRDKDGGQRSIKRLQRLWDLCDFPKVDLPSGESQYCAFLLLKALKTVGRETSPQPRATRAEPGPVAGETACRLKSLTVCLESFLVGPNTANINNCHGRCAFPLVNTKNHAVLLNSHIERGEAAERSPCCVPTAYEPLEVVDLNQDGTHLTTHPDIVAKQCGCR